MDRRLKKFKDAEKIMALFNHLTIPTNVFAIVHNYEVYVVHSHRSLDKVYYTPLKKWIYDSHWNSFLDSIRQEGKIAISKHKLLKDYL